MDEQFEPRLNDGLFPAGRMRCKRLRASRSGSDVFGTLTNTRTGAAKNIDAGTPAKVLTVPDYSASDVALDRGEGCWKVEMKFSLELKDFILKCIQRDCAMR